MSGFEHHVAHLSPSTPHQNAGTYSNARGREAGEHTARKRNFSESTSGEKRNDFLSETPTGQQRRIRQCTQDASPRAETVCGFPLDEKLCDKCIELDLPGILQRCHTMPFVVGISRIVRVGFRSRGAFQDECALCQMFIISHYEEETQGETYAVFAAMYLDWNRLDYFMQPIREENKAICLILAPESFHVEDLKHKLIPHSQANGCSLLLAKEFEPPLFTPQYIPQIFKPSTAKSWLDYCSKHHTLLCELEVEPVRALQVIDCSTLLIEEGDSGFAYVALSYAWATIQGECEPIRIVDGKRHLPKKLSSVVQDSIKVTKALGYRYLWIDKFCIDQNDAELKHDQIQQMNSIYQNAALTIISAAGTDENHGLPGVGDTVRAPQMVLHSQGITVLRAPADLQVSIASSHWSTRGWTFQEALLSRRRLVFTDDQMYFECNTMNCFESIHCPLDRLHIKNKTKTCEHFRAGLFGRNRQKIFGRLVHGKKSLNFNFCRYLSNVEDYSPRNLRYDEDSLNAFKGVLGRFAKKTHSFHHIWAIAYPKDTIHRMDCFVHALAWAHVGYVGKPCRRYNFPSWAWAGWGGQVKYSFAAESSKIRFHTSIRDIHFVNPGSGPVLALTDLFPDSRYEVLHITAPVIPFEWFKFRPAADLECSWKLGKHNSSLYWSGDAQSDDEIHEGLKDSAKWQCVYTGSHLKTSFVMVLELQPDASTWQRAGMFWVEAYNRHFEDMFKGNPCLRTFAIK